MESRLTVTLPRLGRFGSRTRRQLSQVVRKAAFDLEAQAKANAPVDTGFLKGSIQARMTGELAAEVTVGAEYGPHVEYGTIHAGAQPFLGPALEDVRRPLLDAAEQVIREELRGG